MNVSGLLSLFDRLPAYGELVADLRQARPSPSLGLLRAARPALLAALACDLNRPLLVVVGGLERASALIEGLRAWVPTPERVTRLPEPLPNFYERAPWSRQVVSGRLRVLTALSAESLSLASAPPIVVASARALMQPTLPRRQFHLGTRPMRPGQLLDLERTLTTWIGMGYRSARVVEEPGEFSRRGGILDIFPPAATAPIRIELFGDEVESLRHFDPATQRSQSRLERALITPASEALSRFGPRAAEKLAAWDLGALSEDDAALFTRDREALGNGTAFGGIEFYLPLLYSHPGNLLDYFPPEGLVVLEDEEELTGAWHEWHNRAQDLRQSAAKDGLLPPDYPQAYLSWERWQEALAGRAILGLGYGDEEEVVSPLARAFAPGPRLGGQLKPLVAHVRAALAVGERVVVASRQAERLADLWAQEEETFLPALPALTELPEAQLTFVHTALAEGWSARGMQDTGPFDLAHDKPFDLAHDKPFDLAHDRQPVWHLLTDAEIFGWSRPSPRRRRRRKVAPETFFADMTPGDYVVHIEHGVGMFRGLISLQMQEVEREYLLVQYRGSDKLYVPVHQADRLSRFVVAGDLTPKLNKLGSVEWTRVRKQAEKAAEELAQELLDLYATRETLPGHAFAPDAPWQAELEAAFPYIETDDQLRAIQEVKKDMERPRPMDRLLCGDVGYGKTEVALRAAFKAVLDGKQVAILVPTTVLAQQHYYTFRERLRTFPVEVEMLSRFRSRRQQEQVLDGLVEGRVDVVIGTHRLLSKDVQFKNLGLLIIDEEQRFGVSHKERLKQMRTEVDVLAMTATPIPRTLYMSLTGVRDISTIDTPPEERLPVRTHVGKYEDNMVRHAVLREIDRGGQVFFVHNRVQGIEQVARRLAQTVPEAAIAVAHGQMPESELEEIMLNFVAGKVDVLLSTSIVESGLDIPNANTIIVNRADWFGLAQLYQLRGRVGRSAQQAFAYFFYDNPRRLTPDARRRLDTIREASDLGAGYTIAMRDLEIRGAGDILGARQHGHISLVGFDLYTRLLSQAVQELKARETGESYVPILPAPVTIDLPLRAFMPVDYVPDNTLRLRLYRRMAQLVKLEEVDAIAEELADRFGPIPDEVNNLLYQLRIKILASMAGVRAITLDQDKLAVRCPRLQTADRAALQRRLGWGVRVSRRAVWVMHEGVPQQQWSVLLVQTLEALAEL